MNRHVEGAIPAALGTGVLASLLLGCGSTRPPDEQSQFESPVAVRIVSTVQEDVPRTTTQPATVRAYYETQIRAKVAGYIGQLNADIGDYVKAGDPLVVIEAPEMGKQRLKLEARIDLLTAEQWQAAAQVELARASVQSAEAKLKQARSQLDQADASLAAAEAEFSRTEDMVRRGSLQQRLLDEARKKRDSELASKQAAISSIAAADADISVAKARLAAAEADVDTAEATTQVARRELEELDVMIDFATVRAPFSGMVSQRHVEMGELIDGQIGAGSKPLFVLSQIDRVRIRIPVPERSAPFVQPGDSIQLTFPSFSAQSPMTATVTRRSGSLAESTRTMTVEAELDNANGKLLPGMFGQATVTMETRVAINLLPARAVRFDEEGRAYVYVVDDQNTVSVVDVETGMDDGTHLEILSGLEPGDSVIDAHLRRFSDGQTIRPL